VFYFHDEFRSNRERKEREDFNFNKFLRVLSQMQQLFSTDSKTDEFANF
jgi:hypothetical protein